MWALGPAGVGAPPAAIVSGRALWDLFANDIHVVPDPSVPGLSVVLVVAAALVLANVAAAIPGRTARTPTALLLSD